MEILLMSRVNYNVMSDAELKQYFLKHRGDQAAFQAYLDRINQRPRRIIASLGDPDFNEKVQAAIRQKLETARRHNSQQANIVPEVDGRQ
jgi:predicted metal-dependent RNase